MQPIMVNFCVKKPKSFLNYHFSSFEVNKLENFPMEIYVEEVKALSHQERKSSRKIIRQFIMTTNSFLALSSKSMAQTLNQSPLPAQSTTGLPPDLMQAIMELLQFSLKAVVILAIILLFSAAVLRMFGKTEKAIEWSKDILKGLIQALIAMPLVFLIYYVVTLLLGDLSFFKTPF